MIGAVLAVLYSPPDWSVFVNTYFYEFVGYVLQTAQAHNITVDGGVKYNIPSEKFTINNGTDDTSQNLVSYAMTAISGADDFNDDNTRVKDLFDAVVNTTREVTPTCKLLLSTHALRPTYVILIKSEQFGLLGTRRRKDFLRIC